VHSTNMIETTKRQSKSNGNPVCILLDDPRECDDVVYSSELMFS